MSRATLLPTPGDPFLIQEWLRHWRSWEGVGGQLYVGISWPQPEDVVERIRADVEDVGGILVYDGLYYQHGGNLRRLIDLVTEEHVLFMEDDFYVRAPDRVDAYFHQVESGEVDVVGPVRGNGTQELLDACKEREWEGTGMWPHLVFARTEEIRSLTQTFDAPVWEPGDMIVGLWWRVPGPDICSADTFHAAALELWGRPGMRFRDVQPYAGEGVDSWFHIGSLSSGPDLRYAPLEEVKAQAPGWAPRVAWWGLCADRWTGGLDERHAAYREQVQTLGDAVGWTDIAQTYDVTRDGEVVGAITKHSPGVNVFRSRFDSLVLW